MNYFQRFLKIIFIGMLTIPLVNCGRSLLVVKNEMAKKPKIAVVAWSKSKLWVSGKLETGQNARIFGKYVIFQNAEQREMPAMFDKIYGAVTDEIKKQFSDYQIIFVDSDTLPKKSGFLGIMVPDFSGVNAELFFMVTFAVNYTQVGKNNDYHPYVYTLKAASQMNFYRKTKDDVEAMFVSMSGGYPLSEIQKQLPNTYEKQKDIDELMKLMAPESLYAEFAAETVRNISKLKNDMNNAK